MKFLLMVYSDDALLDALPPGEFDTAVAALQKIGKAQGYWVTKTDKTNDYLQLRAKSASLIKTRDALIALKTAIAHRPDVEAVVSLGGAGPSDAAAWLSTPNVRVESYVDQWQVLSEATVYVTHHGLNSTHEAIYHRVPMVAYPFFFDQPALAARCIELGLSVPLADSPRGRVTPDAVLAALDRVAATRASMDAALDAARGWEEETIRGRPTVIRRVLALAK